MEASYNPSYSQLFNSKLSVNVNKSTKRTYFPRIVEETSLLAQTVKNRLQYRRPGFNPWVGKVPGRREWLPTPVFRPGELHGLHSPGWVPKSRTRLSNFHFHFQVTRSNAPTWQPPTLLSTRGSGKDRPRGYQMLSGDPLISGGVRIHSLGRSCRI